MQLQSLMHDVAVSFESVGGYRLVRKLGFGTRAEVFLGHADSAAEEVGQPRSAAIKIFRPETSLDSIDIEIEALGRVASEHCVRFRDLSTTPDGSPALILERLPLGSLGRLIQERVALDAGECVTILAPIAGALSELHRAGVVHGGLRLESVLFRETGAPVLSNFGQAKLVPVGASLAQLAGESGIYLDQLGLSTVVRAVLGPIAARPSVAGRNVDDLLSWLGKAVSDGFPDSFADILADRLFSVAEAQPVSFARESSGEHALSTVPGRILTVEPVVEEINPRRRSAALTSLHLPQWLEEAVTERFDGFPLRELRKRLVDSLRTVRRPIWFAAGAIAVALVIALAIVPPLQGTGADQTAAPTPALTSVPVVSGPIAGDDPVAALTVLLETRDRCIADLSVLCLDGVAQPGSAAMASDLQLIRSIQDGGEVPAATTFASDEITLIERLGGSALLGLGRVADGEPASVLMMKGEAGWRIRDFLPASR